MADNKEIIRFAGEVLVEKVQITSSTGFYQDVSNQVIGIQLFEDLFSPFTSGSLVIRDSLDLANLFPFAGEEFLELKVRTPTLKKGAIEGRFYLYKMTNREMMGDRKLVYELHFISQEAVLDLNKRISRAFSGKCSDIAKSLMTDKEYGLQIKAESQMYIEETKNSTKFISNFWNPVKCLNYLADHSVNKNGSPTYIFFQNRAGFNFVSLETLYSNNDVLEEFVYDNFHRDDIPGGDAKNVAEEFRRIKNISIPTAFDYMENIRGGMYASKQYAFDLTTKGVFVNNFDARDDFKEGKHLNPNPLFSDNAIYRFSSLVMGKPVYYASFTDQGDVTNAPFLQKRISSIKQADSSKIEITVPGRTDYTVGQKVIINLDKMEPISKEETKTTDSLFSGAYLIGAINHFIDKEKHECVMELFKESTLKNLSEKTK